MSQSVKLSDGSYIDASAVWDSNEGKTQQQFNIDISNNVANEVNKQNQKYIYQGYYTASSAGNVTISGILKCNASQYDAGGCYDSSTGLFTCPVSGLYFVSWIYFTNIFSQDVGVRPTIYKNGYMYVMSDGSPCQMATVIYCNKGETLAVGIYFGSLSFYTGGGHNQATFALLREFN